MNEKVTLCCPLMTCQHNTSDEVAVGGSCKSEEPVVFITIEAKSTDYDYFYGKIIDSLVCTGYKVKQEYSRTVSPVREPEGEEVAL